MNSDLQAWAADHVPRSIVVRTAWALVMAALCGCAADVPQESARTPQSELAAPRRAFRAEGEKFIDVQFHPDGRNMATMGTAKLWDWQTPFQVAPRP